MRTIIKISVRLDITRCGIERSFCILLVCLLSGMFRMAALSPADSSRRRCEGCQFALWESPSKSGFGERKRQPRAATKPDGIPWAANVRGDVVGTQVITRLSETLLCFGRAIVSFSAYDWGQRATRTHPIRPPLFVPRANHPENRHTTDLSLTVSANEARAGPQFEPGPSPRSASKHYKEGCKRPFSPVVVVALS